MTQQTSSSFFPCQPCLWLSTPLRRCSGDPLTFRWFIFNLHDATSQTPTAKAPGSSEGSGEAREPDRFSLEPRSGNKMELKSQPERLQFLWFDPLSSIMSDVHHFRVSTITAESVVELSSAVDSEEVIATDSSTLSSFMCSSADIVSVVGASVLERLRWEIPQKPYLDLKSILNSEMVNKNWPQLLSVLSEPP